jgi:UDP-N-acetylmuramoylalanine--D-glutamate ligase
MKLQDLEKKSVLILGFGAEGQATYQYLRRHFPDKPLSIADRRTAGEFSEDLARLESDRALKLNLGPEYLEAADPSGCEVIIKTPGIPATLDAISRARKSGCILTSHSQIFLSNYLREKVIGITGTKGKSTTTALIHHILKSSGFPAQLVGNIGQPPLDLIDAVSRDTYFVHEFSSHQLAEIETSPHIAVLLNIVPEHLDYYETFEQYVAAKENITKFQTAADYFVYAADHAIPKEIASRTKAILKPFRLDDSLVGVVDIQDIPLPGRFNLENVLAAVTAASLCGVESQAIGKAIGTFKPLPHRLENVGKFKNITFYDDSIATVPDATLAALDALGSNVQTLILGGHERHLDFTELGRRFPATVRTVILFPATGVRIWAAIEAHSRNASLPEAFFVRNMEQAVRISYQKTEPGKICLLSPASPSFGMFKDYRERGDLFKAFVRTLSNS